jgi:hypothetical protein
LVRYRFRKGSTALGKKSFKDRSAILDRLLHKSVVLNVRGRSYRLQELEKALK